jgi:hypothetical protein
VSSISDLLIAQGNAAANARSQRGNIYADLIRNLSSLPGQVIQQQRSAQLQDMEQQRLKSQIASAASQQQLDALKVSDAQRQGQERSALDSVWADAYLPDGTVNRDAIRQKLSAANMGHLLPTALEVSDRLDESRAQLQQKQQALSESYRETLGKDALELEKAGNDPGVFHLIVADRAKSGVIPRDQAEGFLQLDTPDAVKTVAERWKSGSAAGKPDLMTIPEGGSVLDRRTMKVVASGEAKPPTESELALKAAGGDTAAAAAMKLLKPAPAKDEFQTFKETYPQTLGLRSWEQLSPTQQKAGFDAYTRMKADPAMERQANAIGQQNNLQNRAQTFAEQQVGRKELTDKVEQPYITAKQSADTLRDVVTAAKAGNKVAGSLQSLETTMAAIRAQGLNRINMAEIGVTAGSGNLWDHITGWVGKAAEGQPVPANIQEDMLKFADILDKAAYKKYVEGHESTAKRYGLSEKPLPPPVAAAPTPPAGAIKVGGFTLTPK